MGFFTSSKPEPRVPDPGHGSNLGGVTNIIRSRFYGKGKERERSTSNNFGDGTPPQDREAGTSQSTHSGQSSANKSFGRALGRKVKAGVSGPSSVPTTSGNPPSISSRLVPGPRPGPQLSPPQKSRTSADTITMTLAQRLGELATANEQGLLDDDEYRLLRANLFERFANVSTVPSEAPIVRLSVSAHQNPHLSSSSSHSSRPDSVHSKASIVSAFSGLLRRATSRRFNLSPESQPPTSSDSMIPPSASSPVQNRTLPRRFLRREASDSSIGSELSARRKSDYQSPTSRRLPRNPPPSSYSIRAYKSVPSTPNPMRDQNHRSSGHFDLNGEHTQSVKELRAEIEAVEAEGRRLLDAFNGLELSTLTKRQRRPTPLQMATETDTVSIHSGRSASIRGPRQMPTNSNPQPLVSQPISLSRKNSLSSMSSRGRSLSGSHHAGLSASSNSLGRFGTSTGSTPSVNNAGFTTLETVDEAPDPALVNLESEMADIRRRRAEVVARYEAKLELLRAKLKGAEMHEKLLKR